jgi:hypothetical protein
MSKNSPSASKYAQTIARIAKHTSRRARLVVLFAAGAIVAAVAFSTISSAQRPSNKVVPVASGQSSSPQADKGTQSGTQMANPSRGESPDQLTAKVGGQESKINPKPKEGRLTRAHSFDGDLRKLPFVRPVKKERPEFEEPEINPTVYLGNPNATVTPSETEGPSQVGAPSAPAPTPLTTFDGLDFATFGAGHPPDTNGDVGPNHYIQTVNTSIGIFDKSTGTRLVGLTFNSFMSQGHFGNLCDTNNFGDPVAMYDSFEDRWIITDFAFTLNGSVINSNVFQCFAVSKTGDPVGGGWNYYSTVTTDNFPDYDKFGVWPDGIYQMANLFGPGTGGSTFQNVRVWALNKAQMYAGSPTVQVVQFDAPSGEFSIMPANARLQTGTPPPGSPNYFAVVAQFLNAESIYKFHVDWDRISLSTFTGPFISTDTNWWEQLATANQTAPTPANKNDELYTRLMMQNQYSNIGGVESLWTSHTVGAGNPGATNLTATQSAIRYYQVKVTGGTVEAAPTQAFTYSPDASLFRYMPSVAVDRLGDMAIGYTSSNATTNPALKYAGRLAGDAPNTITQDEQLMFQGTGAQSGNCGSGTCTRWGDYSTMSLDPDGCTFWYTNEYYAVNGLNDLTRIGSFKYPGCTPVGNGGTVSGTVTDSANSNPLSGVSVALGSRTTTTNASGGYSFTSIPAGTYPSITASIAGYGSSTTTSVVVADAGTTTKNFSLTGAASNACPTDTTQSDFLLGVPSASLDLSTSPGDVTLSSAPVLDQSNTAGTATGTSFGTTSWGGQTFIPAVTGTLVKADVQLFCSGCTGTTPNLTLSVRNTSAGLPTGADLATATIPGFSSGSGIYYTVTFGAPATLTSGTQYALVLRPVATPTAGGYFWIRSSPSTYANGQRVISTDNGATWTADSTRDFNFRAYMQAGFAASGNLVSGVKDANPAPGAVPNWTTLSWTATTPANTAVKFQAAGSNNVNGPFNLVGPDTTASTFFTTSGASISQFNGFRYLKYKAFLTTTNSAATPTLSDVSACFANVASATSLAVDSAFGISGGTTNLSATLTSGVNGVANKLVSFKLNGNSVGSATTNASGVATLPNASLAGINGGTYPNGVSATFAGDAGFATSSGSNTLTVDTTPVANHGSTTTDRDSAAAVVLTGSDADSDPLTFNVTVFPQHGTLNGTAPNFVYVPDENDTNTTDSLTFTVNDGTVSSAPATFDITIGGTPCTKTNVALASNGTTVSASSTQSAGYSVSSVIDGVRNGLNWGAGGGWNDATADQFPDLVQLDFHAQQQIKEVDVYTLRDDYSSNGTNPTTADLFTAYGVTALHVEYFDDATATWQPINGASVTGNNRVLRKVKFPSVTTSKLRVMVDAALASFSRITEVEAYSCNPATVCPNRTNVALASGGATAVATSEYNASYPVSAVIDGNRNGKQWGAGGGWNDATADAYPDSAQVNFNVSQTIDEIDVATLADNYLSVLNPQEDTPATLYAIRDFDVQYWDGSTFQTVTGGHIVGNNKALRRFIFSPVSTDKIRVLVSNAGASFSRITEIEAYSCTPAVVPVPTPTPTPSPTPTPCDTRTNVARLGGAVATASSQYSSGYPASGVVDGERKGNNWGAGGGWNDATFNTYPDSVEVNFNVIQSLDEIDVYTLQDNYSTGGDPNDGTSAASYGIKDFDVQYWDGTTFQTVAGGHITGNNKALRRFTFPTLTTDRIRILVNNASAGFSRVVELEAYSCTPVTVSGRSTETNVARGGQATASSQHSSGYPASGVIDGEYKGNNWGAGGGWNDATADAYPDNVQVAFACAQPLDEIDVYTLRDDFANTAEPTLTTTFSAYGIKDFDVQTWDGSNWVTVPGGSVTGNNKVWRRFTLGTPITTDKVRVVVNNALAGFSRVVELEAYSATPATCPSNKATLGGIVYNAMPVGPRSYVYDGLGFNLLPGLTGPARGRNWIVGFGQGNLYQTLYTPGFVRFRPAADSR